MTTLLQLRRRTRSRLGVLVSDQFFDDGVLDDHINLAIDAIQSDHRWPWLETFKTISTVAGQDNYSLPDDWFAARGLYIGDDELPLIAPSDLMIRPTDHSGRPEVWAVVNNKVYVRPLPAGVYPMNLLYYRGVQDLENDDDTLDMPNQFSPAVVAKAAELLSLREDDRGAAGAHAAEYAEWLQRMRRSVRRTTGPVRIRVREGSWV